MLTLTRDNNSAMVATAILAVSIYDCHPSGFTLPATGLVLELNSPPKTMNWKADAKDTGCGSY
jgi:hypothetical protein